jgi:hypothetical protein
MNWVRLAAVAASAGVLTTFTDWMLAGDWIQKRFKDPEIWRKSGGILSVLFATLLPFISCAAFALLAWKLEVVGVRNCVKLALAIWVIGPLPLILSGAIFLKLHRMFVAMYAASWLVKLVIVAVALGKFIH